jgi:hypothetical protein
VDGYAGAFGGRRTFFLKPDQLIPIKAARDTDPAVKAAYTALIARADAALARKPGSVMDKTTIPLSNDRHDYLSIAPYWWPDPANPSGPYVRRDGEINPKRDTRSYDRTSIGRMSTDAETLALAYYYSDDPRYAKKAAAVIRTWFLDPATAMNPNAMFAQAVPGRENGRAEGVLDTSAKRRRRRTITASGSTARSPNSPCSPAGRRSRARPSWTFPRAASPPSSIRPARCPPNSPGLAASIIRSSR